LINWLSVWLAEKDFLASCQLACIIRSPCIKTSETSQFAEHLGVTLVLPEHDKSLIICGILWKSSASNWRKIVTMHLRS
jgi:hypothetical protein